MRTGAVSGLATKLFSREDSKVAAIIGADAQGETQLEGISCARNIQKAYVFDLQRDRAAAFASKIREKLGFEVVVASSPEVLSEADIICTSTSSPKPVFNDANIKKGPYIKGVR
ncbi:hypothetical protein LA52FAK_17440 [Desulforhopalus sp. 52FAK]